MPRVTIIGAAKTFELSQGTSLQELQFSQDTLPFGCCSAACGTCAMEVIEGAANLSPKNDDEHDVLDNIGQNGHNRRLACQCSLLGDVTIKPV
ncbi:2Fe-2S iron-sulfur cluster-binding protein [Shewanella sp. GXUN23E]|uniref:2Fe-2S iron-sulfur cluster-binding protein n=1 Tax=Shewanella sp. GXUN23E TaxID=3422498 RepID=UPI003D7EA487